MTFFDAYALVQAGFTCTPMWESRITSDASIKFGLYSRWSASSRSPGSWIAQMLGDLAVASNRVGAHLFLVNTPSETDLPPAIIPVPMLVLPPFDAYPFSVPIVTRESGYSSVMAFWPSLANSLGARLPNEPWGRARSWSSNTASTMRLKKVTSASFRRGRHLKLRSPHRHRSHAPWQEPGASLPGSAAAHF